ncbi:hypothetical protein [Microvirga yunnanensis]|uniref:hypothetical protein n=1 Tax=Microvirga yunnanensis TaxID=2953740 RepID=UPI0021C698B5|nr:hypothetical protein [Microvirga sp. HBU67655]
MKSLKITYLHIMSQWSLSPSMLKAAFPVCHSTLSWAVFASQPGTRNSFLGLSNE